MKKFLICFFVLILTISLVPIKALASDGVDLSKLNIETKIAQDGSINMEELITYDFKDKYNGAYRDISTKNTDGLYNLNVLLISKNGQEIPFKKVTDAKDGDTGVFELIKQENDLYRIKIYSPSDNEKKTFKISYTMKNVAIKYNDIGEFFYTYWSDYNDTEIDNLKIRIDNAIIPDTKNIRAYYHGISNGMVSIKNGSIEYTFPHVNSNELVETRVLFPLESIPLSTNVRNENGLSKILNEEAAYREKQQLKIIHAKLIKKVLNIISLLICFSLIILIIVIWIKFRNSYSDAYDTYSPYDIPEDCSPAVAAYLVNGTINGRTIYATILDLWRKGYLNIEKIDLENKLDKVDFIIKKSKSATSELLKHEIYLMNWIFNISEDKNNVRTSSIKEASKDSEFNVKFQKWLNLVKQETKSRDYYDKKASHIGKWLTAISISTIVISIIALVFTVYLGILCLILSIFILICGIHYWFRKSPNGNLQYTRWIKFKKYIKNTDFTYTDDTDYMEKYIPYAEALNMNKSCMLKFKDAFNDASQNVGWIYYYLLFNTLNLNKNQHFNNYMYGCFGMGYSGMGSSASSSSNYGGSSSGSAGGGGAGGF